jgi:competence protein ComEC
MNILRKYSWLIVGLAIAALVVVSGCSNSTVGKAALNEAVKGTQTTSLKVKVLDIGQGDAILIQVAGQVILVDSGDVQTRDKLVSYIKSQGITTIDKVLITHPHADHLGGMAAVLENFTVKQIYDSGQTTTTALYRRYLATVQQKNIPFTLLTAGNQLDLGGGAVLKIFAPGKSRIVNSNSDLNNNSIVAKLVYGNFSMLLTGDAEQESEEHMLKTYGAELKSTLLKSGHHGSRTSSSLPFLKAVAPDAAIISVGSNNDYQHPHPSTLKKYAGLKIKTYRTDTDGTVTVITDGKTYTLTKEKQ